MYSGILCINAQTDVVPQVHINTGTQRERENAGKSSGCAFIPAASGFSFMLIFEDWTNTCSLLDTLLNTTPGQRELSSTTLQISLNRNEVVSCWSALNVTLVWLRVTGSLVDRGTLWNLWGSPLSCILCHQGVNTSPSAVQVHEKTLGSPAVVVQPSATKALWGFYFGCAWENVKSTLRRPASILPLLSFTLIETVPKLEWKAHFASFSEQQSTQKLLQGLHSILVLCFMKM